MSLPRPPFVNVEGVRNLRDIGGYSTTPGYCTRRGLIYRSADFGTCTENGLKQLEALDVKAIFDLRSKHEVEKAREDEGRNETYYDVWTIHPDGPRYNFAPVFEDSDYSPEALAKRFKDYASEGTEVGNRSHTRL